MFSVLIFEWLCHTGVLKNRPFFGPGDFLCLRPAIPYICEDVRKFAVEHVFLG